MNATRDPSRLLRCRDSIYAADLLVCAVAHLDFFSYLKNGPRSFEEISANFAIAPRPADVMLSLFGAMELIEKSGGKYGLTGISKEYLVSGTPSSLVPYYASLQNRPQAKEFREVLHTGKPAGWSSKKEGPDWLEAMKDERFADEFTSAMDSRGAFLARRLAEKIDLGASGSLLDIAGGSGVYACSIADKYDKLKAAVLEIPPVDRAARRAVESRNMADRVKVVAGDMFREIPEGYDLHLFSNVLHDWDMGSVRKLVGRSFESLPKNGALLVFDAHLNKEKNGPPAIAEYSCLLMHSTEGRCYSTREISETLMQAGFRQITVREVAAGRTIIQGKKK